MYLCRELANIPLKSIGQCMGNRDHTTIMHGCDKIEQELQNSQTTQKAIEILKKKLQPGKLFPDGIIASVFRIAADFVDV